VDAAPVPVHRGGTRPGRSGDRVRHRLSAVVMAHPRRAEPASRLAARLGRGTTVVYDPAPDAPPSPLRTAALACMRCVPGTTHDLVVQDDMEPCARFWALAGRAVARFPDCVLTLYANGASDNGGAGRIALLAGHTWLTPTPHDYFPTVAVVMPCGMAHEFGAWATARLAALPRQDDHALRRFLTERGYPARLRVPSLVEHRELPSLAGNHDHGIRRSVCFQGTGLVPDTGSHVDTPPAWPQFYRRRTYLRVDGGPALRTLSGDDLHAYLATPVELLREIARKAFPGPVPAEGWSVAGLRFVRELCVGSFCLGRVLAAIGTDPASLVPRNPLYDNAIRSFVESGLGDDRTVGQWAAAFPHLLDGCWLAMREGMRCTA